MTGGAFIDLRSDTVTRPSEGMYRAIAQAAVGDDVYGEDETVNRLEAVAADLLGKPAGLFVSSATQANLIAMLTHCRRGEEVITGDRYHVVVAEAGGASALGGVVMHPLKTDADAGLSMEQVLNAVKPDDPHCPMSRLLVLENTVSGRVQNPDHHRELIEAVRPHGLRAHLDGARLMNASVALGRRPADVVAPFDSVMLCLSKGLGAPVGAMLCGDKDFIASARRLRKQLGGGMRQAGILAACGLYALENNVERLTEDHARAARLADGIADLEELGVYHDTNMVFIDPPARRYADLEQHLAKYQVRLGRFESPTRLVTHLDIGDKDIDRTIEAFHSFYRH